jgi:hypothetical protein
MDLYFDGCDRAVCVGPFLFAARVLEQHVVVMTDGYQIMDGVLLSIDTRIAKMVDFSGALVTDNALALVKVETFLSLAIPP